MMSLQYFVERTCATALVILSLILLLPGCGDEETGEEVVSRDELAQGFVQPPDSVKPWVYWYWISDNISKEGITRDLEAMARVGVGEAFIGNIGLDDIPSGKVQVLSEEWWQLVEHTIREGKRVGVNIGMFNCPGWSQSGGPWVKPEEAMRYLVSSEVTIQGGKQIVQQLPRPTKAFQDVRVLAFPRAGTDLLLSFHDAHPRIRTEPYVENANAMVDGDTQSVTPVKITAQGLTIDIETDGPYTARSLVIRPARKGFAAAMELQAFEDGSFRTIRKFLFDRSNVSVSVGPMPFGEVAVSFVPATSNRFRLVMRIAGEHADGATTEGGIAEIALSTTPRLESYVEKQLGKMHPTPFPLWSEYQWTPQPGADQKGMGIDPVSVIDISKHLSADGFLTWDAPGGMWTVMRIGVTPTGTQNSPAAPHGRGFEVDKMNRDHLRKHFDAFMGVLLRRMPAADRTALKHVVLDSYEQGSENWTEGFAEDFQKRYGYDPVPWLPVISGRIVSTADESDRFLWDLRRMVADRVAYDYVGGLRDLSQEQGLRVWLENYGHWGFPSEFLMYGGQSHDLGGEFWAEGELGNIECRAASSAAHVYGKRRVSAESYTAAGMPFRRYPAMLKKRGDWSYTEGINHVVLHVYIHQPYEEKTPGMNAWFGIEFNRKNTWFEQSKKWIEYQRRCMYMLQRGRVVNDVCYFIGEDTPKMTGVRDPEIPRGYSFDYINAEVILKRLSVKDGRLVLPDGMSYRMMVLPPLRSMRPELLRHIGQLVTEGATILGPPPDRAPGLQNYPVADSAMREFSAELWGKINGTSVTSGTYGKGRVLNGMDLRTALEQIGVAPDVSMPDSTPVLWIHRRLKDVETYFITNQSDETVNVDATFRVAGKQPELWDAVTGTMRDLPVFMQKGERTIVPLHLEPSGSAFIVFARNAGPRSDTSRTNFPAMRTVVEISSPWHVRFDSARGGPGGVVAMKVLEDWTKSADEKIRHYSGSALYTNTFVLPELSKGETYYLDLGKVGVMADVKVNGSAVGGVWTAPWRVDVTGFLRTGENTVEIDVVNTWVNRLVGDSRLAQQDRSTWVSVDGVKPTDPLEPSGLLGPVTIRSLRY